jgi:4-aminobutyrate aminotransferase-like enzyme
MAAAAATLDVLRREDAPGNAAARGRQLQDGLEELAMRHEWIGEVRGMGLMQALELVEDRESKRPSPQRAAALLAATKEEEILVGLGGLHGHVVRIGPSLLISEEETAEGLARLGRACERVEQAG